MRLTVNGRTHEVESAPLTPLLHVLREDLTITSPKAGCLQGGCGACTVLVDGQPMRSCLLPVAAVDGAEVTTLEGIGTPERPDIEAALSGHVCRCTGYVKILASVEAAAGKEMP